jgi:hypothetical protein
MLNQKQGGINLNIKVLGNTHPLAEIAFDINLAVQAWTTGT